MLYIDKDIRDPSRVLNYVDSLRELKDRVDPKQADWLENECCLLESRVHEAYTPFEFFIDAAILVS